jgi:hypothetical protein
VSIQGESRSSYCSCSPMRHTSNSSQSVPSGALPASTLQRHVLQVRKLYIDLTSFTESLLEDHFQEICAESSKRRGEAFWYYILEQIIYLVLKCWCTMSPRISKGHKRHSFCGTAQLCYRLDSYVFVSCDLACLRRATKHHHSAPNR